MLPILFQQVHTSINILNDSIHHKYIHNALANQRIPAEKLIDISNNAFFYSLQLMKLNNKTNQPVLPYKLWASRSVTLIWINSVTIRIFCWTCHSRWMILKFTAIILKIWYFNRLCGLDVSLQVKCYGKSDFKVNLILAASWLSYCSSQTNTIAI